MQALLGGRSPTPLSNPALDSEPQPTLLVLSYAVSRKEFHKAMPVLGVDLPKRDIDDLFDDWDPDGSGAALLRHHSSGDSMGTSRVCWSCTDSNMHMIYTGSIDYSELKKLLSRRGTAAPPAPSAKERGGQRNGDKRTKQSSI